MRNEKKRAHVYDGTLLDVIKSGDNKTAIVKISNGYYDRSQKEYVHTNITQELANPAQAEGLTPGMKVALFRGEEDKFNLVRDGEWKSTGVIKEQYVNKQGVQKEKDNGFTVIMGRCVSARLVTPKEGGKQFEPFFSMRVITNDHVAHDIAVNNFAYGDKEIDNVGECEKRFRQFLKNDKQDFVPFVGTFVVNNCYREEQVTKEYNGQEYTNDIRKYSGFVANGNFNDFEKAPTVSKYNQKSQEAAEKNEEPVQESSELDMSEGFDMEELPFD